MNFKLKSQKPPTLEIYPNRGGRITVKDDQEEAIVEGGIPRQIAITAIRQLIDLGVLIQTPTNLVVNRNSIFLKRDLEDLE